MLDDWRYIEWPFVKLQLKSVTTQANSILVSTINLNK
jgi:hypothetical protein